MSIYDLTASQKSFNMQGIKLKPLLWVKAFFSFHYAV